MDIKNIYRKCLNLSTSLFGMPFTKKMDARIRFHRKIDLKSPKTLADKLSYMELYIENPLKIECSDKSAVRAYVQEKGLDRILVPLVYKTCSSIDQIVFSELPQQFVMKATHGCGMNLICENKNKYNEQSIKKLAKVWLDEDYPRSCIEPHYKKIKHQIIFEKLIENADSIVDYKFHCFHGVPDFILVCGNRSKEVRKRLYSLNWEPINEMIGKEKSDYAFQRPSDLEEMIHISTILAKDFDFVRVDLYDVEGKVFFGELTFSPASGVLPNFSDGFIQEKGALLHMMGGVLE